MVSDAVIWRVLEVHQVILAGLFEVCVCRGEAGAVLVDGHLHGAAVLPSEVIASASEVGHGRPAGADAARAADTVTLALQRHEALHSLERRQEVRLIGLGVGVCVCVHFHFSPSSQLGCCAGS